MILLDGKSVGGASRPETPSVVLTHLAKRMVERCDALDQIQPYQDADIWRWFARVSSLLGSR
jgi:hypothetical protein